MAKQMVATETFRAVINGYSELLTAGESILDSDHEVVRKYPDRFVAVQRDRERPDVEDASADPGRKRGE